MSKLRVVIGPDWKGPLLDRFSAALPDATVIPGAQRDPSLAQGADVIVPFAMKIDRNLLASCRPALVQQFGVGVDVVDLEAARDLNIPVTNMPSEESGMASAVAEGAILLMLLTARLPGVRERNLRDRTWSWSVPVGISLAGKRCGLIGFGSIGRALARRLVAMDMDVVAVTRSGGTDPNVTWWGTMERLDELLQTSDFVILSTPLNEETRNLINRDRLRRFKQGANFINVGRGAVVDEVELVRALDDGILHAAGLDTICQEPPPVDSPLLHHDRVVLTTHTAGVTDLAFDGQCAVLADNLERLRTNQPLRFLVQ